MKAEHRHELQTNALAEWVETSAEKVRPYTPLILVGIAAVAIVIGILSYLNSAERNSKAAAADAYIGAVSNEGIGDLQATVAEYRGTEIGVLAQLQVADRLLTAGSDALYTNKAAGRENVQKAAEAFTLARDETRDPMLRSWALFGLGRAHESLGDLDKARSDYQLLLKDYPNSSFAATTKQNLEQLNRPGVKEFYDWFAKQDPRPAAPDPSTGIPGLKPSFDIKDPRPGDIRLPTNLAPGDSSIAAPRTDGIPIPPLPEPSASGIAAPEGGKTDAVPPADAKSSDAARPTDTAKPADSKATDAPAKSDKPASK
jgi:tetratricopeptide (TPR) repeat protein